MPVEKPYTVTTYDLIDRTVKPPTVKPGREYSRHTTESATQRSVKAALDGCLTDGPRNIVVVTGPPWFEQTVWVDRPYTSQYGRTVSMGLRPARYTGGFTVVEDSPMPADPSHPWLPWSHAGDIRYRDPGILDVDADTYPVRSMTGDGWRWSATVTPYVVTGHDRHGNPNTGAGRPVWSGVVTAANEADAKRQAERWILVEIRKARGDNEHEVLLGS